MPPSLPENQSTLVAIFIRALVSHHPTELNVFRARRNNTGPSTSLPPTTNTNGYAWNPRRESPPASIVSARSEILASHQSHTNTIYIPIEIVDEILLYLLSDEPSLRNCALVCKSWTPICRSQIFFHVGFEDFPAFARWCESFPATPDGPHLYTRELEIDNCLLVESG